MKQSELIGGVIACALLGTLPAGALETPVDQLKSAVGPVMPPASAAVCNCAVCPERENDFVWENDKFGMRAYGPGEYHKWSGFDVFNKNTSSNVCLNWCHRLDKSINFHHNYGFGMDNYTMGASRGVGGVAMFADGEWKTYPDWEESRVLHTGDDCLQFELVYPAFSSAGRMTCRITLRRGERFFRNDVRFERKPPPGTFVGPGIDLEPKRDHKGNLHEEPGLVSLFEDPKGKDGAEGSTMEAVFVADPSAVTNLTDRMNCRVLAFRDAREFTYWAGASWSLAGEITTAAAWHAAVKAARDDVITEGETLVLTGERTIREPIVFKSNMTVILDGAHLTLGTGTFTNMFRADGVTNVTLIGRNGATADGGVYNGLGERTAKKLGKPVWLNNTLLFTNVKGFRVEGIRFTNQRWWALNFIGCSKGVIRNLDFLANHESVLPDGTVTNVISRSNYAAARIKNADGVDLRVGCHDILIENITGFTEDDTVALTALTGGHEEAFLAPDVPREITDVTIRNVRSSTMCANVRLLAQGGAQMHRITVDGVEDASDGKTYLIGRGGSTINLGDSHAYRRQNQPGDVTDIVIRNVRSRADVGVWLRGHAERVTVENAVGFDGCPHPILDKRLSGTIPERRSAPAAITSVCERVFSDIRATRSPARLNVIPERKPPLNERVNYGLSSFLQLSPRRVLAVVNRNLWPATNNWDSEDGNDLFIIGSLDELKTAKPIALNRTGLEPDETQNGEIRWHDRFPAHGGFVPVGALLDGKPHPHAGTGFLIGADVTYSPAKGGTFIQPGGIVHSLYEIYELAYDGENLSTRYVSRHSDATRLAIGETGWAFVAGGLCNAIPDGPDLLWAIAAVEVRTNRRAVGMSRWVRTNGRWLPRDFTPVSFTRGGYHSPSEPSLVRDARGYLVFTARDEGRVTVTKPVRRARGQDMNAWLSRDNGKTWTHALELQEERSWAPVTVGRTVDGKTFVITTPAERAQPFGNGMLQRNRLSLWQFDGDYARILPPVSVRDVDEFPPAPEVPRRVDHPVVDVVRLADGRWHAVLSYRVRVSFQCGRAPDRSILSHVPNPADGAYAEELVSVGTPVPVWSF